MQTTKPKNNRRVRQACRNDLRSLQPNTVGQAKRRELFALITEPKRIPANLTLKFPESGKQQVGWDCPPYEMFFQVSYPIKTGHLDEGKEPETGLLSCPS